MTRRHDTSPVPLQGAYLARRCPVRAQNDTIMPGVPLEPDAFQQRLFDLGNAYEVTMVAALRAANPQTVAIEGGGDDAEAATLAAMQAGAPLILNGRLTDPVGRRLGKPDLLVRASGDGYRAVDIKWHMALDVASSSGRGAAPALVSTLADPTYEAAHPDAARCARRKIEDVLQLAHYQRILEAIGLAAGDGRHAGIIGTEGQVVWGDLDAPIWRTPSLSAPSKLRSAMERYDFEFDFRLDIIAVARQHQDDPRVDLLVVPVRCSECPGCPWNEHCRAILEVPPGDVSLLPRVGWDLWKVHRDCGVSTRAELAALDVRTARLVAARVDVSALIVAAAEVAPATPVIALAGATSSACKQLSALGIDTSADVLTLDAATARYSRTSRTTSLPQQIDLARAALGRAPAYRRRGVDALVVRRADVEVDIDMENTEVGAYLWGNLVTRRMGSPGPSEYVPFVTWQPLTPEVEAANSLAFWRWLMDLRTATLAEGRSFAAYCWSAQAENRFLRRIGLIPGRADEVEAFISSTEWVDLHAVWDDQVLTGGSSGLKVVAPLVGVSWTVDEPGGGESMVRYDEAIGAAAEGAREAARRWVLTYNRGDVEATLAVREWLDGEGRGIPRVESLEGLWGRVPPEHHQV